MTVPDRIPDYDELPRGIHGWRTGWGVFGDDDQIGLLNLLTPEVRRAASSLVRHGSSFPLDAPMGTFDPPLNPRREAPVHTVITQPTIGFDDAWDRIFPQAGSQWDSLAHVGMDRDLFYNGATRDQVQDGSRNGVGHWAEQGIVGRAILLDVSEVMSSKDSSYCPGDRVTFGVADLEEARRRAGVEFAGGDVVLLYSGFAGWYSGLDVEAKRGLPGNVSSAGLEPSEEMCRYLWDSHISAIAADNFSVEAWPANFALDAQPFGFLHQMLIGSFGMALGELWWLDDLVADCRSDGVYESLLVSTPWNVRSGISSPANAIALK